MSNEELRKNPMPWFTPSSINFIESILSPDDTIIEFGGGWSSIWFAKKVKYTLTIEASPAWAATIINEMQAHPGAMAKWSLKFVPSEWNPTEKHPKQYWTINHDYLSDDTIRTLNDMYLKIDFDPSVIVIDGSIRPMNIIAVNNFTVKSKNLRMIIVDNMESLRNNTVGMFKNFKQYDFHEYDLSIIPKHQNGEWCTSVWIKE